MTFEQETVGQEATGQEQNWRLLETDRDRWKERAEAAESALANAAGVDLATGSGVDQTAIDALTQRLETAEAQARRGAILEAGFNPDSGQGKALLLALEVGDVEAEPGALVQHAQGEYGWAPGPTSLEASVLSGDQRLTALSQQTVSDGGSPDDAMSEIAAAREDGDWGRAASIERQVRSRKTERR